MNDMTWKALNRLAKWRTVLTGWQLGTRSKGDPEGDAVRDHREATLLQRVDINALTGLLMEKGVFSEADFEAQLIVEADALSEALEAKFPGFRARDDGMSMDARAAETMRGWKP